jgi:hypothetical protein
MKSRALVGSLLLALTFTVATAAPKVEPLPPIVYVNKAKPGPQIIVLPGEIKTTNQDFKAKFSGENIADFAELELGNANFKVLERADLASVMQEVQTAYSVGDPDQARKILKKGRLKTTKFIIKFDVLKAELVEAQRGGFNGAAMARTAGGVFGSLTGIGRGGQAALNATDSVHTEQIGGTWLIGMRYKVIDANTTEQVAQGYHEDTVEVGGGSTTVAGITSGKMKMLTLDSVVQRLIQENVADIDANNK